MAGTGAEVEVVVMAITSDGAEVGMQTGLGAGVEARTGGGTCTKVEGGARAEVGAKTTV